MVQMRYGSSVMVVNSAVRMERCYLITSCMQRVEVASMGKSFNVQLNEKLGDFVDVCCNGSATAAVMDSREMCRASAELIIIVCSALVLCSGLLLVIAFCTAVVMSCSVLQRGPARPVEAI